MNSWIVMDNYNVKPGVDRVWVLWRPPGAHGWDLCATTGDGRVYAWKAESGELVYSNQVAPSVLAAYPMADHKKLVLLKPGREAPYMGGPLSSYDLQTHQTKLIDDCVPHASWNVSPDGHLFAYIATNNQVRVWDVSTEQTKYVVRLPDRAHCIEFSPDSRLLAVSTIAGWLQVFDAGTGQSVSDPLAEYWAGVYRVTFSADSKSLVTCGNDGTARIWNIATSREMVSGLPVNRLPMTVLPPDGNSVVESAGEWAVRVVRLPTLAEIDALEKGQMQSR
jgi:WD40 repeat protein